MTQDISPNYSFSLPDLRVLIVEDQDSASSLTNKMLQDIGVSDVVECDDAEKALALLEQDAELYDVVICDWNMPGMSGIEFLTALRADSPDIPFLMASGRSDMDSIQEARNAGATGYIRKPFSPSQLEAQIRIVMQKSRTS